MAIVQDYLARTNAYYNVITGVSVHGHQLDVRTNLGPDDKAVARELYDKLWSELALTNSEAGLGRIIILDRDGHYLDGGSA